MSRSFFLFFLFFSFFCFGGLQARRYGCAATAIAASGIVNLTSTPTGFDADPELECFEHLGCIAGARIAYCLWDGLHIWPGSTYALDFEDGDDYYAYQDHPEITQTPERYWGSELMVSLIRECVSE